MLKKFVIGVIAFLVLVYVVALFIPGHWKVETSIVVKSTAARVYQDVATLSTWVSWSPWNRERDPECKHRYSGPSTGVGSTWNWEGDPRRLDKSRMVITKADPTAGIEYEILLEGHPPTKGRIDLEAVDGGTRVVWKSAGTVGGDVMMKLMMRYMTAFGMMENELHAEYSASLEKLKFRVETPLNHPTEANGKKK